MTNNIFTKNVSDRFGTWIFEDMSIARGFLCLFTSVMIRFFLDIFAKATRIDQRSLFLLSVLSLPIRIVSHPNSDNKPLEKTLQIFIVKITTQQYVPYNHYMTFYANSLRFVLPLPHILWI
jgi:hypothetical protein